MTWPSARHFKVTVTFENFQKNFFTLNDVKLPKMAKFSKKNFSKILRCDGHLKWRHSKWPWPSARHFKVTVTFERVTVTSLKWRADGQSHLLKAALQFICLIIKLIRCLNFISNRQKQTFFKRNWRWNIVGVSEKSRQIWW